MSTNRMRFHVFPINNGFTFEAVDESGEACAFGEPCATRQQACEKIMTLHPFGDASIEFGNPPGGERDVTIAMVIAGQAAQGAHAR